MDKIVRPDKASQNLKRQTTTLITGKKVLGEFYIRGGICWPIAVNRGDSTAITGFAILLGLDIETEKAYVFEERSFVCIDHVLTEKGAIEYEGISAWFNMCWQRYFGQKFYYHQEPLTHRKFRAQVQKSTMIQPKPRFIQAKWQNDAQAAHTYWERQNLNRIFYRKDEELHKSLQNYDVDPSRPNPAAHALLAALVGLDHHRWKEPPPERIGYDF